MVRPERPPPSWGQGGNQNSHQAPRGGMRRVGRRRWCARSALPRHGGRGEIKTAIRRRAKNKEWEIKRRDRKPVSVFESAIYLRNLPPDIGRAALICQYIWFCRPWCRTRNTSLQCAVGSYPTFSPSLPGQARRQTFSVTAGKRLLPSAISAAGRPFLSGLSSPAC